MPEKNENISNAPDKKPSSRINVEALQMRIRKRTTIPSTQERLFLSL